jgi:hypothetical protein
MRIKRAFVVGCGFALCVDWPIVITSRTEDNGHFSYSPINGRVINVWIVDWCVIIVPTLWLAKRLGKK